jgi:hypothetical protein
VSALALVGTSTRSGRADAILSTTGIDVISRVPLDRWDLEGLARGALLPPRFGGFLPGVDLFDAALFGLSAGEAELMDAQQRILLEAAYEVRAQLLLPWLRAASLHRSPPALA